MRGAWRPPGGGQGHQPVKGVGLGRLPASLLAGGLERLVGEAPDGGHDLGPVFGQPLGVQVPGPRRVGPVPQRPGGVDLAAPGLEVLAHRPGQGRLGRQLLDRAGAGQPQQPPGGRRVGPHGLGHQGQLLARQLTGAGRLFHLGLGPHRLGRLDRLGGGDQGGTRSLRQVPGRLAARGGLGPGAGHVGGGQGGQGGHHLFDCPGVTQHRGQLVLRHQGGVEAGQQRLSGLSYLGQRVAHGRAPLGATNGLQASPRPAKRSPFPSGEHTFECTSRV